MEKKRRKTKCGITVGLFGAAIYLLGLFSGFMVAVLLTGYVLLFEEDEWLKKCAIKAITVMAVFSSLITVANLIPNAMSVINSITAMFGGNFYLAFISNLVDAVVSTISIVENVMLLGLGVKALNQGTIAVPIVDNLIDKYME